MTRIVASANQKGGVGKTTTVYHLARAAQQKGLRVLAIDIDPQGSLTSSLAKEDLEDSVGLADVLSAQTKEPIENVLAPTIWEGVDLVPTTGETLSFVRDELITTRMGRESKLKKAIQSLGQDRYDLILIDCPPSIDQLTINAMVAANAVLIVTHASYYSLNGIAHLIANIEGIKEHYNPELCISGIVVNQYERNLNAPYARKMELSEAMEQQGITVFEPAVPKRTMIAETAENGQALDESGSEDNRQLVKIYDSYVSKIMGEA